MPSEALASVSFLVGRTAGQCAADAKRILDGAAAEHAAIALSARWIAHKLLWVPSHIGW
jgi:hypothetical protein